MATLKYQDSLLLDIVEIPEIICYGNITQNSFLLQATYLKKKIHVVKEQTFCFMRVKTCGHTNKIHMMRSWFKNASVNAFGHFGLP
jgi:hypothetical protein